MRLPTSPDLEKFRAVHPTLGASPPRSQFGYFEINFGGELLRVISSGGATTRSKRARVEWEHVSVSLIDRCPTWDEMVFVKQLFWADDETVLQFHPMKSQYINAMPFCLHLWKAIGINHPLPPSDCLA